MTRNLQKEEFSIAYVHAVAALADCSVTRTVIDINGYDLTISATNENNLPRLPRIDVQLKCSARDLRRETSLNFALDVPTYRKLTSETLVPRVLVVLVVPPDLEHWITQTEEEMTLKHGAYWVSLYGQGDTENEGTVTVHLPREQLFTPLALTGIMNRVNQGHNP